MKQPLKPNLALLVKLGSIAVHVEELLSPTGHAFDRHALQTLLGDNEVQEWIKAMGPFMPVKRRLSDMCESSGTTAAGMKGRCVVIAGCRGRATRHRLEEA